MFMESCQPCNMPSLNSLKFYQVESSKPSLWALLGIRQKEKKELAKDECVSKIKESIVEISGCQWAWIISKDRHRDLVRARYLICHFAKILIPKISLNGIAGIVGNRDHTTILHAKKEIKERLDAGDIEMIYWFYFMHKMLGLPDTPQILRYEANLLEIKKEYYDKRATIKKYNPEKKRKPSKEALAKQRQGRIRKFFADIPEEVKPPIVRPEAKYSNKNFWENE